MNKNYLKDELYQQIQADSRIFELFQDGSVDGIWYWDLENPDNEWMSSKFWLTLGYDPKKKEHLSSEWKKIIFEEDLEQARLNFENQSIDLSKPYDEIIRYRHKNGSTVWMRCRGIAITDENNIPIRMIGSHMDITDLKEAEQKVARISREYEKVFNGTQDAMFLIRVINGNQFRYIRNNLAHQTKTGIQLDQIKDKSPQDLLGKELGDIVSINYQECVDTKKVVTYEEELALPVGNRIWSTTLTPIVKQNHVAYIVGSAYDITEKKRMELKLEHSANYDKLTGLPNRRFFFENLDALIQEDSLSPFVLLFIDLDGFKAINDHHGHDMGDAVLSIVGKRLLHCIRTSDVVARIGGDEFSVILMDLEDYDTIKNLVDKLHQKLQEPMLIQGISCKIDSSIGIARCPQDGRDSDTLLKNADTSMYIIKHNGKSGYHFFNQTF